MAKKPNAKALGRLGGMARAESLSDSRIVEIARMGGRARVAKMTSGDEDSVGRGQSRRRGASEALVVVLTALKVVVVWWIATRRLRGLRGRRVASLAPSAQFVKRHIPQGCS